MRLLAEGGRAAEELRRHDELHEIAHPERSDGKPLVGGGRYDGLLAQLGAAEPTPAVGCSIWIERVGGGA